MSAPLSEQQLAEIRARVDWARAVAAEATWAPGEYEPVRAALGDVPALLAEVERLRADRDAFADRVDTLTAVAKSNKRAYAETVATVTALEQKRVELERVWNAERERVAELEQQLAAAVEHRDHWHAELMCADARIAELDRKVKDTEGGGR